MIAVLGAVLYLAFIAFCVFMALVPYIAMVGIPLTTSIVLAKKFLARRSS